MNRIIFHGEVFFREVKSIPKAKKITVTDNFYIVGESETHGNDHRITYIEDQVELYMTDEDKLFIKNLGNTQVYCPNKTRHDTIILPEGMWEVGHAMEYDYYKDRLNKVID